MMKYSGYKAVPIERSISFWKQFPSDLIGVKLCIPYPELVSLKPQKKSCIRSRPLIRERRPSNSLVARKIERMPPRRGAGNRSCISVDLMFCANPDKKSMHAKTTNPRRGLLTVRCLGPSSLQKVPKSVVVAAGRPEVESSRPRCFVAPDKCS